MMKMTGRWIMKKSVLTAIGMALVLLIYGYLASAVGHDHSSHSQGNTQVENEHVDHGHNH